MMPPTPTLPQEERSILSIEHGWHDDLLNFVQTGLPKLLVMLLIAGLAQWAVKFFVSRLRKRADALSGNSQRAAQLRTIAGIFRATAYALIGAYLLFETLGVLGYPLGSFIAAAGVIGLGISFGAQSLFKDVLNGAFVLFEDQYSVGDVVKLAGLQGTVEDFTLRITKLRDGDGTLHIVPNSQVATVSNLSRDYSVASLPVSVNASENPDRVMTLLREIAASLRAEPLFRGIVLTDPDILGIDRISGQEVIYLVNLRVRATQRDPVLRELRRRILLAFEGASIAMGTPNAVLLLEKPDGAAASGAATSAVASPVA